MNQVGEQRMPELSRSLQPRHITMISIGGMIGAGLFVSSSAAIAATGPAIVLSYLLTGTLVLLVMRMLGEMAMSLPNVRSFTEFARAGLGSWGGFVAGWLYWYFWMIVVPVEAIAGANILHAWFGLPPLALGLVLMGVMTAVNLMSARSYGEFEFWFASIKVAAIIVFIALALAFACGFTSPHGATFANLSAFGGFAPKGWVAVLAGAVTVYFSLTGAEITTIAAAESKEPARAVARMSSTVIVRILTFYVGSVLLIVSVVPWINVRVGESPFTLALTTMQFRWASLAMSVIILTAVLSCLNSAFYVCSRVLFVLAEHGDAPQWLVQLNERRVPTRSVWMGSLAGVLGIIAATVSTQTVFAFLVNASGALMVFIYMMITVAHIRLRRAREAAGEPPPALSMWLFPWASYAALIGMAAVLVGMALTPAMAPDLRASILSLLLAIGAFWLVNTRRRARAASAPVPGTVRP
ncbi:MAG: amino acid permease [Gammaproteobacteria bacterium]|nr:amino acid permease [Gammaproteobacteria bacterium]MBV9697592.1 amino acid permease [Gammaproteobacteria bacterium]